MKKSEDKTKEELEKEERERVVARPKNPHSVYPPYEDGTVIVAGEKGTTVYFPDGFEVKIDAGRKIQHLPVYGTK